MSLPDSFMNYSLSVCGYIIHTSLNYLWQIWLSEAMPGMPVCRRNTLMKQWGRNKKLAVSNFILKRVKLASMLMQRKGMKDKNFLNAVSTSI